ncbi:hypothetical protein [Halorarum halobium]|uniref:hypothetical protein n=1 Tax=Halorarum halobium TaxID=3075121 RepID=UPI0028ACE9BC|nr:hypothetical protein [Halobaculum sp. XH14]
MVSRRRTVAVTLLLLPVVLAGLSVAFGPAASDPAGPERVGADRLIHPAGDDSSLWPYTSRRQSVTGRTLAINLVVHGDTDVVRDVLEHRGSLSFEPMRTGNGTSDAVGTSADDAGAGNASRSVAVTDDGLEWTDAHGAVRYSYVDSSPDDPGGRWVRESYQLRDGPYLGSRYHVRAYASPEDDWTALQVHADYWDWFRLRHTVPRTHEPARRVEADFIGEPYVEDVDREYYGIRGGRSDGWLSVVHLAAALLGSRGLAGALASTAAAGLLGIVSSDRRLSVTLTGRRLARGAADRRGGILLAGLLAGLVLGVRTGGIALETTVPWLHPKLIAAALYPVLALGMPLVASRRRFTRGCDPATAFTLVGVGTGIAFVLSFATMGVAVIPVRLVFHRGWLLAALGLIAAGTARGGTTGRHVRLLGAAAWVVGLAVPLLDLL